MCGGGDGEVNKVSCTYGCSDHCHGLQHGQVIGVDVSSDISFNVACYSTMAQAGKAREGGRTRRSMAKRVLHGCHITHMGINWKQSTVYKPHHIQCHQRIRESNVTSGIIHSFTFGGEQEDMKCKRLTTMFLRYSMN